MLEKLRLLPRFLQGLAGARQEVLARCPAEAGKFENLGWSVLITSGMGMVSMWFALSTAMGINGVVAVLPAVAWGLVIMGIDRWLITSMPHDGKRKLLVAAPRLVLAFLLGTLISTPFVLRIFEAEINAQISVIKEDNYNNFIAQQQTSTVGQQVTYWTGQVSNLQAEIDSGGAKTINPADDPEVKAWTSQRNTDQQVANQEFKTWQCQLYGVFDGVKCPKGNGPLAQASENSYNSEEATIRKLNADIQSRESTLSATNASADKLRLDQAQQALPNARSQLATAETREDNLRNAFNASNDALNGILVRLEALSQLSRGNFTVTVARFLVFLLFLVIEILPVTVKIMQRPGPYEEIYAEMQRSYVRNAKKAGFRTWTPGVAYASSAAYADSHPADGPRVIEGHADPSGGSVRDLFHKTRPLPRGFDNSPDRQPTEVLRDGQSHQSGLQQSQNGDGQSHQDGFRDSEFHRSSGSSGRGFQRGTTSSYQDAGYRQDQQDGYAGTPTRNESPPSPTRQEAYFDSGLDSALPAPTRHDGYQDSESYRADSGTHGGDAHPGNDARPDAVRLAGRLPLDETRRDLSHLPAVMPGQPGSGIPNPFTDSGGLPLAHRSMLNMNDNRPPGDFGAPDGGELNWDED